MGLCDREIGNWTSVEQYRDRGVAAVRADQVRLPIAIEIAREQTGWSIAGTGIDGRIERSRADPGQDRDVVRAIVGDGQVRYTVEIEISSHDGRGAVARCIRNGGLKTNVLAEKNGDVVRAAVRDGEIVVSVAIEVRNHNRTRGGSGVDADRRLERSVSVSGKYRDIVGAGVGNGEIDYSVGVEISGEDGIGRRAGCRSGSGSQGRGPVARQYGNIVRALIGDGEIEIAVAVEVAGCHRVRRRSGDRVGGWCQSSAVCCAGSDVQSDDEVIVSDCTLSGRDKIHSAIAIEIGEDQLARLVTGGG